jgi:hypothetical protein
VSTKHTGMAENMKKGGADESSVARQNAPLRDLHQSGHELNESYKIPGAYVTNIKANASYMHPHGGNPFPSGAMQKANAVKPMMQMGAGKK